MKLRNALFGVVAASILGISSTAQAAEVKDDDREIQTVQDALADSHFLSQFDRVDLDAAEADKPILITPAPTGQSSDSVSARAWCYATAFTSPTGANGPTSNGCGVAGSNNYYLGYGWSQGTAVSVCTSTKGWSTSGTTETWTWAGCGGTGGNSVHWGNVIAMSAFRASGPAFYTISVSWWN